MDNEKIKAAANALHQKMDQLRSLGGFPYQSVGIGDNQLFVYLEKKPKKIAAFDIPSTFDGFPVITKVIGKIKPL